MPETLQDDSNRLVPGDSVTLGEVFRLAQTESYQSLIARVEADGHINLRGQTLETISYDERHRPVSEIVLLDTSHAVTKDGETTDEHIPAVMEFRTRKDERHALQVQGANGQTYVVTCDNDAPFDRSPITLNDAAYQRAWSVLRRSVAPEREVTEAARVEKEALYTSQGVSTSQVVMQTSVFEAGRVSLEDRVFMHLGLRYNGFRLRKIQDVAVETNDAATFTQMIQELTPDEVGRVLDARAARKTKQPAIPAEVPTSFLTYSKSASQLSATQMTALRHSQPMRKLYARLQQHGYNQVNVDWALQTKEKDKEPRLLFANVTGYRSGANGNWEQLPMPIRGDVVVGASEPDDGGARVQQARPAQETGRPPDVSQDYRDVCPVSGLYMSGHSTDEILLRVPRAEHLAEEMQPMVLPDIHGHTQAHDATHPTARADGLTSRLLALLGEKIRNAPAGRRNVQLPRDTLAEVQLSA